MNHISMSRLATLDFGTMLAATPADAFSTALREPSLADRLFVPGYLTAFDYVAIVVALIAALGIWLSYYQSRLLPSLKEMQPPSRVKLRALGLAITSFAALLLVAPALPKGWILLLAIFGLGIAVRHGYQQLIAAILAGVLVLVAVWRAGIF